jgi:hypothetical protein
MPSTYFLPNDGPQSVSSFVRVSAREDGLVTFSNAWGGFVYSASEADFDGQHREVSEDVASRMLKTYKPIRVTVTEGDGFLDGWTNDGLWNGWEKPLFTVETAKEAISPEGYLTGDSFHNSVRFFYLAETNDILMVETETGKDLGDIDVDAIIRAHTTMSEDEAYRLFEKDDLRTLKVLKFAIKIEGEIEPKVVFQIGDGWCWEDMMRYEHRVEPAVPRLRM